MIILILKSILEQIKKLTPFFLGIAFAKYRNQKQINDKLKSQIKNAEAFQERQKIRNGLSDSEVRDRMRSFTKK